MMVLPSASSSSYHDHDFEWEDLAAELSKVVLERDNAHLKDSASSSNVAMLSDNAMENWETFYRDFHHGGTVYKPRRYLATEFPILLQSNHILEIGCGYGSSILPIIKSNNELGRAVSYTACDLSQTAIDILKSNPEFENGSTFVWNATTDDISNLNLEESSVDVVLMIFCLSAINPKDFPTVADKVFKVLRPGGVVCFRDYGRYDLTMMRAKDQLGKSLYCRPDKTLAYFFTLENLTEIFTEEKFEVLENRYCTVKLRNRKTGVEMNRVWVHGVYKKI